MTGAGNGNLASINELSIFKNKKDGIKHDNFVFVEAIEDQSKQPENMTNVVKSSTQATLRKDYGQHIRSWVLSPGLLRYDLKLLLTSLCPLSPGLWI